MNTLTQRDRTSYSLDTGARGAAALFSVVVIAFGIIAIVKPTGMLPEGTIVDAGVQFFGKLISVRNVGLGIATLLVLLLRRRVDPRPVLALSALVQAGDCVIGGTNDLPAMAISAGAGTVIYASAYATSSRQERL